MDLIMAWYMFWAPSASAPSDPPLPLIIRGPVTDNEINSTINMAGQYNSAMLRNQNLITWGYNMGNRFDDDVDGKRLAVSLNNTIYTNKKIGNEVLPSDINYIGVGYGMGYAWIPTFAQHATILDWKLVNYGKLPASNTYYFSDLGSQYGSAQRSRETISADNPVFMLR